MTRTHISICNVSLGDEFSDNGLMLTSQNVDVPKIDMIIVILIKNIAIINAKQRSNNTSGHTTIQGLSPINSITITKRPII